jgi:hypothetical protein
MAKMRLRYSVALKGVLVVLGALLCGVTLMEISCYGHRPVRWTRRAAGHLALIEPEQGITQRPAGPGA